MQNRVSAWTLVPYSRIRRAAQDLAVVQRKHLIHALFEADVTRARAAMCAHEQRTGEALSFTAFILACVARAVDEDKTMHAYRKGRRHLILYDNVDVTTLIEGEVDGQKQALFHIVRSANHKTLCEIHREIRFAQKLKAATSPELRGAGFFEALPGWVRRLLLRMAASRPGLWKARGGTVAVTSVGMFGKGMNGWGIPLTCNTLAVTVGGIGAKPGVVDGQIAIREYLSLTVSVDHDIIDGGPATRFCARLKALIESGYALPPDATDHVAGDALRPAVASAHVLARGSR
jgi:pyruvate/2-oxoglutarate dehydrogenase complex dihydrolipoamide acyltransferase (E2) component